MKLSHKWCPHCRKELNIKPYKEHKRLYFNESTKQWLNVDEHVGGSDSDTSTNLSLPDGCLEGLDDERGGAPSLNLDSSEVECELEKGSTHSPAASDASLHISVAEGWESIVFRCQTVPLAKSF